MFLISATVIKSETRRLNITYMDSCSPPSKELWCFNCNCIKGVCLHNECPQHCDMCIRIRELAIKSSISPPPPPPP